MTETTAHGDGTFTDTGPIDFLVIEFPGNRMTGEAWPLLVDLVDRGIIHVLDLVFIRKEETGEVTVLSLHELEGVGVDVTIFEGAGSGLMDEGDLAEAANAVEPGCSAGVLVYENAWAAPFAAALRRSGGQLVAFGRVPIQAILAELEAQD